MKIVVLILSLFLCGSSIKAQTEDEIISQLVDSLDYYNRIGNGEKVLQYVDLLRNDKHVNGLFVMEANGYTYLKQYDKAISILNDSIKSMKDAQIGYSALGAIYELQDNKNKAIEAYEKAKAIKTTYARPYIQLGSIYSKLGEKQIAVDNYLGAIRLFAEHRYYNEMEVFSEAVIKLDSTNIEAYKFLQYSYFNKNDHSAVINIGLKIDDLCIQQNNSKEGFANRVFMAMSLYVLKDYENTIDLLKSAGSDEETWNEYAYMICGYLSASYEKTGNKDKSKEYRELAKKINPDGADAWIDRLLN
jgi:tetratricopeptide (TPR) repeat protein